MKELSETEEKAYNLIKEKGKIPIVSLPKEYQGAVGKLKSKGLIEIFRERYSWKIEKESISKMTNWVKIKE